MSERKYRIDICPECKVRETDSLEKKLYQCRYCERWFCERHLEPRLAVFRDLKTIIKDAGWRDIVEKEWKREGEHPDYAYTVERLQEHRVEREIIRAKLDAFLKKSRAYEKTIQQELKKVEDFYPSTGKTPACPDCGSKQVMITAFREEFEAFECLSCHYTWKELREAKSRMYGKPVFEKAEKEAPKPIEAKGEQIKKIQEKRISITRETKKLLSTCLISVVLSIIGLGIVYWQVHSPALIFLLIFYVIPIPLILIGIVLFFIGFLSSVGISGSMIKKPSVSTKLLAVPLIFSLVLFSFFGFTVFSTMHRTIYVGTNLVDVNYVRGRIFYLINEERLSRNLPVMLFDQKLADIAQIWSEDLAKRSILEHGDFEVRMSQIGYGSYQCGEIIAQIDLQGLGFFQSPLERQFLDGWLESTEHRKIMLMSSSGYLGIGVAKNSGSIYAVADFRFD